MTCPKCGAPCREEQNFCEQCGFGLAGLRQTQALLRYDPVIAQMNRVYAALGIAQAIAGGAAALSVLLLYLWLENDVGDFGFHLAALIPPPALIALVVCCALRGAQRRKIARAMRRRQP